jgi:LPS sulfotransferase NodH
MHYVILCQGRTGSTYLVRLLRSHPGVVSHGELFHPRAIYYGDRKARMDAEALAARDADPVAFLEALQAAPPPGVPVGFKIFPSHSAIIFEHVRARTELRRILLRRDNLLAQFSSGRIAERTGRFTQPDGSPEGVRIHFDEREFLRFVQRVAEERALLEAAARADGNAGAEPPRILSLEYRELFAPGIETRLAHFLDIRCLPLRAEQLVRQNTGRIPERFEDPRAVRKFLVRYGRSDWAEELPDA